MLPLCLSTKAAAGVFTGPKVERVSAAAQPVSVVLSITGSGPDYTCLHRCSLSIEQWKYIQQDITKDLKYHIHISQHSF